MHPKSATPTTSLGRRKRHPRKIRKMNNFQYAPLVLRAPTIQISYERTVQKSTREQPRKKLTVCHWRCFRNGVPTLFQNRQISDCKSSHVLHAATMVPQDALKVPRWSPKAPKWRHQVPHVTALGERNHRKEAGSKGPSLYDVLISKHAPQPAKA